MLDGSWVDNYLLTGPDGDACLRMEDLITRGALRRAVLRRATELAGAGLGAGGTVSLRLPPSLTYVVNLLAAWHLGAQVSLLDHRLTQHEVDRALHRLAPQLLVSAPGATIGPLRGYTAAEAVTTRRDGEPARTDHVLLQLSSGSTGPSKVIGRSAASLVAEVQRYQQIDGAPRAGERMVLLASMVHVLGLVGGLLYALHTGVRLVLPRFLSTDGVLAAIASGTEPTTVIGVPFHLAVLTAVDQPPRLPQLTRVTVGGELVRPAVRAAFADRYAVPLGTMYGMTELGVIATDLYGQSQPALRPAPGMTLREEGGEVLVAVERSPYVGLTEPGRWLGGWLHTRDAGTVDPATGLVTIQGRLDSQVSVGGLKVDLTEVEHCLCGLPGVAEAVVVYGGAIEAFVVLDDPSAAAGLKEALAARLAPYKRPRRMNLLTRLPRTATGKLVRNARTLATAERAQLP
ncbi:MAG TPA: fatty acid--CoA ligase family protein [Rugosimonospora sp.]|nr:fatty acid--CoA ligase family protein [Rugosimonospora sp.]